jgi:hypothetical protein
MARIVTRQHIATVAIEIVFDKANAFRNLTILNPKAERGSNGKGNGGDEKTEHSDHLGRRYWHGEPQHLYERDDGLPDAQYRSDRA